MESPIFNIVIGPSVKNLLPLKVTLKFKLTFKQIIKALHWE